MIKPGQLHWYSLGRDGVPELYLDNHMMQSFRACEQFGVHSFIENYSGKGRVWFLDFGSCLHKMIEIYYEQRHLPNFELINWATNTALEVWNLFDMEYYRVSINKKPDKGYELLGGYPGFVGILSQYANIYHLENERYRIIGTELYFGKKKEVFLGTFEYYDYHHSEIYSEAGRVYLSGKIDLLADNGTSIGPIDHKSTAWFKGDPASSYRVHEGMTGYVYAARELVKTVSPDSYRRCNTLWLNMIQVKPMDKIHERFKRISLIYTDEALESYRQRMLRTASKIYQLLQADDPYSLADRDTMHCTDFMHGICPFYNAHKYHSRQDVYKILDLDFVKKEWNPETRDEKLVTEGEQHGKISLQDVETE